MSSEAELIQWLKQFKNRCDLEKTIPTEKLRELYMFYNRLIANPEELREMEYLISSYREIVKNVETTENN